MLIVTRRPGERVMIGDDVVVAVIDVKGSNVRIGIDAPREVAVFREELLDKPRDGRQQDDAEPAAT